MDQQISPQEIRSARLKRIKKIIIISDITVVSIAAVIMSIRPSIKRTAITLSTAQIGTLATTIPATGIVVPAIEEIINSPITSKIIEVYRRAGDSVDVGTPLLRLDLLTADSERKKLADECQMKSHEINQTKISDKTYLSNLAMQIKVKEMSVNRLFAEMNNERRLDSIGSGTGEKVREVELAYQTGKLELQQLQQQLVNETNIREAGMRMKELELAILQRSLDETDRMIEEAQVKSPRKAILTTIISEIGQQIQKGDKLAVVSDLSRFKLECEMSENYVDSIYIGAPILIKLNREKIQGHVSNLTPLSKNGAISFTVIPENDSHPRLRSGQKPEVYVQCGVMDSVLYIKNSTYYMGPGKYDLFVLTSDNEAEKRKVELGQSNFESVEVISGIKPGERVIISDTKSYTSNSKLRIK